MTEPVGLISDVHGNWPAFEAVLADMKKRGIKNIWFLGDVVDFGPWPHKCLEVVNEVCGPQRVLGNHDLAVAGIDREEQVDKSWLDIADWTAQKLGTKGVAALHEGIALTATFNTGRLNVSVAHALPVVSPKVKYGETTPYIYAGTHMHPETPPLREIGSAMVQQKIDVAAYGHTHIPFIYAMKPGKLYGLPMQEALRTKLSRYRDHWYRSSLEKRPRPCPEYAMQIERGKKIIVNVPACGQPRDNDPRTGYAIISEREVRIVRLNYKIQQVTQAMSMSGMPLTDSQTQNLQNFLHYGDVLPTHSQKMKPER